MASRKKKKTTEKAEEPRAARQLVVTLKREAWMKAETPRTAQSVTQELLERVKEESGEEPRLLNLSENLGYFVVDAPGKFADALSTQPEVHSIADNTPSESMQIAPVKRRPAKIEEATKPRRK